MTERHRHRTPLADHGWQILVLVVCIVVGLLLATTRHMSAGNEIRRSDTTRLSDLVRSAQTSTEEAETDRENLSLQLEELQRQAASGDADVGTTLARSEALNGAAGLNPESGPGVVVTLTDAPRAADGRYASDASPDDLVVHQQDVQSVLNALWTGGASAIAMQDQRIVSEVAPRCIGNTLLLGGRTYSPPYVVTALGDPARLDAALANNPGVRVFQQYALRYGLGYRAASSADLEVPGHDGPVRTRFAQPAR
ncbi:DUF881 domain-containing protein [Rhodococcoides yunnanense]|uniref:DUF881 domain-containing protein n=1 Tax=Rhodococcoides yunnanense TaxID=278209 RepID=UPI000934F2D4|nr:DUF881 domain-containing protein [Rhodococcus yunnanensis]